MEGMSAMAAAVESQLINLDLNSSPPDDAPPNDEATSKAESVV